MKKITILSFLIVVVIALLSFKKTKESVVSETPNYQCTYVFTTVWDKVEFEVRTGNANRCGDKEYKGTYTLYKGETLKLSGNGLCYRRRTRPSDSRSNWNNWVSEVMCTRGRTIKVRVR